MTHPAASPVRHRPARRVHPIVIGGTIAGILDILAAFGLRMMAGGSPVRVLHAIASGVLGPAAFQGGAATAALGFALHFVIAFGAAAVYYAASRVWPVLARRAIPAGLLYGVAVYAVMNYVVLPLSRVTFGRGPWRSVATMVVIHMLCVGLPIALAARAGRAAAEYGSAWRV